MKEQLQGAQLVLHEPTEFKALKLREALRHLGFDLYERYGTEWSRYAITLEDATPIWDTQSLYVGWAMVRAAEEAFKTAEIESGDEHVCPDDKSTRHSELIRMARCLRDRGFTREDAAEVLGARSFKPLAEDIPALVDRAYDEGEDTPPLTPPDRSSVTRVAGGAK